MLQKFKVSLGKCTDYSRFDRENWLKRSLAQHCEDVKKVLQDVTKTKTDKAESKSMFQDIQLYYLRHILIK